MSINLTKLSDLKIFYENVPYYINKGGQDGMAELAQHYKTLTKIHNIRIPKIVNLLEVHLNVKCRSTAAHIKHLEHAAMLLASTRSEKLSDQIAKLQARGFSELEEKRKPKIQKIMSPVLSSPIGVGRPL